MLREREREREVGDGHMSVSLLQTKLLIPRSTLTHLVCDSLVLSLCTIVAVFHCVLNWTIYLALQTLGSKANLTSAERQRNGLVQ